MLISKLTLCDVGLFRGRVEFDLTPKRSGSVSRSIILIGGLNGSGKTTILMAIRLAFYGRLAVGSTTSAKAYDAYIEGMIHSSSSSLVRANSASVSVEFEHSQLGVRSSYLVSRSWTKTSSIRETLSLSKDGKTLDQDGEQIQALLNQLVPIGIADLFFFDGERISSLATEDSSPVLADSVKKLIGLQLIERLQSDLSTYLRQTRAGSQKTQASADLAQAESERAKAQEGAACGEQRIAELASEIARLEKNRELEEGELSRIGGAWAKDREAVRESKVRLEERRTVLKENVRQLMNGEAVFSLLGPELNVVAQELEDDSEASAHKRSGELLKQRVKPLQAAFRKQGVVVSTELIRTAIEDVFAQPPSLRGRRGKFRHFAVGESEAMKLLHLFQTRVPEAHGRMSQLCEELAATKGQLDALVSRMSQTPEESLLLGPLGRIKEIQSELIELKARRLTEVRDVRAKYWLCFELTRRIRRLEEELSAHDDAQSSVAKIAAVYELLDKFALALKKDKLAELATSLEKSFAQLSRKTGLISSVEFDQETFAIAIKDKNGLVIPKKKLSAGEQQIFAISVLDALLTCSRRSLPLVIDTPLGRLDSVHRGILVKNYLPTAAHQVIVLSTDTEVDQLFYEALMPFIARAYHLRFDESEGATTVEGGYFWKEGGQLQHAA